MVGATTAVMPYNAKAKPRSSEVFLDAGFRIADCSPQFDLGRVVSVKTRNQRLVRAGDRLLRLDHFDVVRHTGGKTVASLDQCLIGQIDGVARDFNLVRRRLHIQEGVPDVLINLRSQVVRQLATLPQRRSCLQCAMGVARVVADVPVINSRGNGGVIARDSRPARQLCRAYLGERALVIGSRCVSAAEGFVKADLGRWRVGRGTCQHELLARW